MFFKSIDNCLNEELCDKLIAEFITNPNKAVFNNQDQAFSDRVLHFQNIADPLKTQKGLLLAFDKNESHGVKPISDAPRYTLSMWFTDKREHATIAET